jgi:hypothetical protein
MSSPEKARRHSSLLIQGKGNNLLFNSARVGKWKSRKSPFVRKWLATWNGCGGWKPFKPASLYGARPMGLYNCPYRLSAESNGLNGRSSGGNGKRSAACCLSRQDGLSTSSILYDAPGNDATIHQGPVKGCISLSTCPCYKSERVALRAKTMLPIE